MMILDVVEIHRSFKTRYEDLHVLRGATFSAREGEVTCIVGPSGSGKSTLLHILGGLDRPDRGEVVLDSVKIFDRSDGELARFRNRKIGFIFQFHHLLPEFSALENAMMPLIIGGVDAERARSKARAALKEAGLVDRERHRPNELSGGERQRVAVARARVNEPRVVFADEPSGNLDIDSSNMLHELVSRLSKERRLTFVIVTHNMSLAERADRKLKLAGGRLEEW